MLEPNNRRSFVDALRPPPGYILEAGLGSTYGLELEAFTAVLLAFVGADLEAGEDADRAAVIGAVTRLRQRLRVFANSGSLRLEGRRPNRLVGLYDRMIRSVALEKAAFHPKLWILAYAPRQTPELRKLPPVFRVLCSSRNVTTSTAWELGVELEGQLGEANATGQALSELAIKMLGRTRQAPPALWRLIREHLPRLELQVGREGREGLEVLWQWPGMKPLANRLPTKGERALVISPFVRATFVEALARRFQDLTVISTARELDALAPDTRARIVPEKLLVVKPAEVGADLPGLELHAKLMAFESREGGDQTIIGSANATAAAWGMGAHVNCEAAIAFRPGLGIDRILSSFVYAEKGILNPWIEQYQPAATEVDETEAAAKNLEQLQRALGWLPVVGRYDRAASRLVLSTRASSPDQLMALPERVVCRIAPLLVSDEPSRWRPFETLFADGASFEEVSLRDLCSFAVVELYDPVCTAPVRFGLQFELPLSGALEADRDSELTTHLLEGADPRQLLWSVLWGAEGSAPPLPGLAGAGGVGANGRSILKEGTIERILEACTEDAGRIEQIDEVLRACGKMPALLPFVEFWKTFRAAHERAVDARG